MARTPVPILMDHCEPEQTCFLCDAELPDGSLRCPNCMADIDRVQVALTVAGVLAIIALCAFLAICANTPPGHPLF